MEFASSQKRKWKIIRNGFIYIFQKDLMGRVTEEGVMRVTNEGPMQSKN